MELLCECPPAVALTTIPNNGCPSKLGQIQKVIFQRPGFAFDEDALFTVAASWTPLLVAAGATKIVVSPFIEDAKIGRAEAITRGGGDNTTINGRKKILGENSVSFTGLFANMNPEVIDAIRLLAADCEELVAYFMLQGGRLAGRSTDDGETVTGIPVYSVFANYAGSEGYATDDMSDLMFELDPDWRSGLYLVKPAFNPQTVIKVA